ncbi:hypothetical protein [Caloranaerobacter azorensis]|uniref:Uncharacterized protein n=1 Tax=Caloranaerobacter azorensis TaxID=116090 RepID=A0A6P1YEK9_9FIRM|nr:hypothetical protein [Caloranaerobacter azorensis]QIB27218.1 hypothetical protein G3A45_07930 [Caloranaerobacter azorensis]
MYIRQISLISFEEIIKFQQETKLEMVLSQLDVFKLANNLRKSSNSRGLKGYEPTALIYALIAINRIINNYKSIFKPTNYTMDFGYEFKYIYSDIINRFNGISIITYNFRGSYAPPEGLDKDFNPICSAGLKLVY